MMTRQSGSDQTMRCASTSPTPGSAVSCSAVAVLRFTIGPGGDPPGTGGASERGAHDQILNIPLHAGTDGAPARTAWREICARVEDWRPQLVLVSAGFDAHAEDPLAGLLWDESDFTAITRMICDAAVSCSAPVVSVLEGGYDLGALGRSARAHVDVLRETAA